MVEQASNPVETKDSAAEYLAPAPAPAHWADAAALRIIKQKGEQDLYTLASGISPSGTVHIGNFRELITVDFVARALRYLGKKTRFIFSWDDYDVFRKVPENMKLEPKPGRVFGDEGLAEPANSKKTKEKEKTETEITSKEPVDLENYIGKALSDVPCPSGKYESYAQYHQQAIEKQLPKAGIRPDFLYQNKKYKAGEYNEAIKEALLKRKSIRKELNKHRTRPLDEAWLPITVYCRACGFNELRFTGYDEAYNIGYFCKRCQKDFEVNFKDEGGVKLLWRVDWPMRWRFEKVDFEPGGKDHSSEGGSYQTACKISKEVFEYEAPIYQQYDFVLLKGQGSKISASKGNVISLEYCLSVYEPEVLRFIFASYKPNVDFSLGFGDEVINAYDSFDKLEAAYFEHAEFAENTLKNENSEPRLNADKKQLKKLQKLRSKARIYQLSQPNLEYHYESHVQKQHGTAVTAPFRAGFRHLTSLIQIHDFNEALVLAYYQKNSPHAFAEKEAREQEQKNSPHAFAEKEAREQEQNTQRLKSRIQRASFWIRNCADDIFRFSLTTNTVEPSDEFDWKALETSYKRALEELVQRLLYKTNFATTSIAAGSSETEEKPSEEKKLFNYLYELIHAHGLENKKFFQILYKILINKEKGPRIAGFLLSIGREKLKKIFSKFE